jgi:hypothetical protein
MAALLVGLYEFQVDHREYRVEHLSGQEHKHIHGGQFKYFLIFYKGVNVPNIAAKSQQIAIGD